MESRLREPDAATTLGGMQVSELPHPVRLRRGYVAVRRDDESLQVGLDAPARAVLPDTAEVRRLLADLDRGVAHPPRSPGAGRSLAALAEAGLLEPVGPPGVVAVSVDAPDQVRTALGPVLRSAGLRVGEGSVTLVADDVPVPRRRLDALVRAGRAHLVVAGTPREWTVGPFVLPGATACVRCVDAHLAHADPRRTLVLEQLAGLPRARQRVDPLARLTALALAVADLRGYLAGQTPATWSATYTVGAGAPVRRDWARHPHCGCAWDLLTGPG